MNAHRMPPDYEPPVTTVKPDSMFSMGAGLRFGFGFTAGVAAAILGGKAIRAVVNWLGVLFG